MFNLDQAIAEWRRQMLAGGIKSPVPLEELESHLREEVGQQMRSGLSAQQAFEAAVQQIGAPHVLRTEFAKMGLLDSRRLVGFRPYMIVINLILGAILTTPHVWTQLLMFIPLQLLYEVSIWIARYSERTSHQNTEPRWATYFKTIAFILPAILLWVGSCVLLLPKLKQICSVSNTVVSTPMWTALDLSELFKNHLFVASIVVIFALILLEWRSRWWAGHRRLVFGIAAFLLNSAALILITTMFFLAVVAGANLMPAK